MQKEEIFLSDKDVPSEFPKYSSKAQGAPILEWKNFENQTSFRDVINAINQIIRQKSNLANQPILEDALRDTQLNRTVATISYIQYITIYQNSTENSKWLLLAAMAVLMAGFLVFSSRGKFYK